MLADGGTGVKAQNAIYKETGTTRLSRPSKPPPAHREPVFDPFRASNGHSEPTLEADSNLPQLWMPARPSKSGEVGFRPAPPRAAGRDHVLLPAKKRGDGLERRTFYLLSRG